jgi:hypothetical protein
LKFVALDSFDLQLAQSQYNLNGIFWLLRKAYTGFLAAANAGFKKFYRHPSIFLVH